MKKYSFTNLSIESQETATKTLNSIKKQPFKEYEKFQYGAHEEGIREQLKELHITHKKIVFSQSYFYVSGLEFQKDFFEKLFTFEELTKWNDLTKHFDLSPLNFVYDHNKINKSLEINIMRNITKIESLFKNFNINLLDFFIAKAYNAWFLCHTDSFVAFFRENQLAMAFHDKTAPDEQLLKDVELLFVNEYKTLVYKIGDYLSVLLYKIGRTLTNLQTNCILPNQLQIQLNI